MSTTLGDARRLYGAKAGARNSFTDRLNEVISRLLPEVNGLGTKVRLRFAVYVNARGDHFITTPEWIENVLAGAYEPCPGATGPTGPPFNTWGGRALPVRNGWFEFTQNGPGNMIGTDSTAGILKMEGRFTTFADWSTAMRLRIKPERSEAPGIKIIFRGSLEGERIYSLDPGGQWMEGVGLTVQGSTVTTTQTFDEPPYQVIKPITKGRLRIYAVDADDNETLVADYNPQERNPAYNRYVVPACTTTP